MVKRIMIFAVIAYGVLLILMFVFQRNLQYRPAGQISEISSYGLQGFVEKKLTTASGKEILAWYKEAPQNSKLILYFHGNAGNLGDRAHRFAAFAQAGFGVLAISYEGYSGSEGKSSEVALIQDSEAALKFVLDQNYMMHDLIYYGESLGSGVATQLASRFDPSAVILESPYSSIASVAQKTYWFVPVKLLLKDKFESIKYAAKITAPLLIFHGTQDQVVPYLEGKKLYEAVKSDKKLISVSGAGHLDFSDEFLVAEMQKFLAR